MTGSCTRMVRYAAAFAASVLAGTFTAGCSSSGNRDDGTAPAGGPSAANTVPASKPGTSGAVPDPCSLVSRQQIQSIIGEDPGAARESRAGTIFPTERECGYGIPSVIIYVGLATDYRNLRQTIEHDFGSVEPVQGVGQEAFWDGQGKQLVARGQRFFVQAALATSTADDSTQIAQSKQILTAMLGKL